MQRDQRIGFGAVYRMVAGEGHEISWHDDLQDKDDRQVGLSLSTDVFRGGAFEIRERLYKRLLAQVNDTGFGDALLFRVSSDLEHRVTPVANDVAKTAFTGWFCATDARLWSPFPRPPSFRTGC